MQPSQDVPLSSLIGLGIHLLLGHLAAVLVALWIGQPPGLAVLAGVAAGLAVTATLQRTVWLVTNALDKLSRGFAVTALPTRWHFLLSALVVRLNIVIGRVNGVTALRNGLLRQTGEAAAQQERNRLARDLHDSIKQQVFSISMSAAAVDARWETDAPGARQALGQVQQGAREALVEMTTLLQQLSPAPLEKVGLVQAIRDQCEALGYRTGAEVTVTVGALPPDDRLPAGAPESLFRIVQEAISNIARHARASRVQVALEQRGEMLVLEMRDDGQGFDTGAAEQGMGLTNIQQRVSALRGRLAVESVPHQGTRLTAEIPLLESLFAQEDFMVIKAEHALNRVFLAGAAGGLALIAALFYPLYLDWPGRFVADWPGAEPGVSLALSVLAVGIVLATGYMAARWARVGHRAAGTLVGALAGWLAVLTVYVALVAPAAGAGASRAILEWGYRPGLNDAHALWLIAEPVINSIYWTYAALWAAQLIGLALGALGGTFAPASARTATAPELRAAAATVAGLMAFINGVPLVAAPALFNLLEGTLTGKGSGSASVPMVQAVAPYKLSLPPEGVALIPTGSALVLFAITLAVLILVRASQRRASDPVELYGGAALSFGYALLSAGVGLMTVLIGLAPTYPVQTIASVVVCLVFAGLFAAQGIGDLRRREPGEPLFAEWNPLLSFTLIPVEVAVAFLVCLAMSIINPRLLLGLLLLVVLSGLVVFRLWGTGPLAWLTSRRQADRPSMSVTPDQFDRWWQSLLNVLSVGLPVALLVMSQIVPTALTFVSLIMPGTTAIFAHAHDPLPPEALSVMDTSSAEMIRALYLVHAQSWVVALLVVFVIIGLVLLWVRGWQALMGRINHRNEAEFDPGKVELQ